ncbi:MAG: outer membrane protein transport protein [bacterium]|nr:MAG: outer membrane protein transport protein [bacterium]
MKIRFILLFLCWLLVTYLNDVSAGSFYDSRGLGEIKYFSNAQAIGMGGSLIAVPDRFQINVLNPAGLVFIPLTRLSGDFLHEAIWNKTNLADGFAKYTNLNGISLAIPVKVDRLVASLSIIPTSQFDYEYSITDMIDNYNYQKIIRASGGLNKISFGFGLAVTKNIYLGGYFHHNFGKLEQTWMVDYVSEFFWDSIDKLTRKMWGVNWTGGLIVHPVSNLYFGAIYSGKYKLTFQDRIDNTAQKSSLIYDVDNFESAKQKLKVPEFWGLGTTYVLKQKFRLSSDFIYQSWSDFKQENNLLTDYNDSYCFGIGIEMLPSNNMLAKYYEKMSYRAGFFYRQLDFQDESANNVTEYGISAGAGFPYYGTWGRIDVALRYAQRGELSSNPVKEDIFQLFISVTGGEKWFGRGN